MQHTTPSKSAAARAPVPVASHCWPVPLQEMLTHSKADLAQSLVGVTARFPGSWCAQGFVCALRASLAGVRFDLILNAISPLLLSCWGVSFAHGHGVSFFSGIQHSVRWLFSRELQFWWSCRRGWAHILLLHHLEWWGWSSSTLATWCEETTQLTQPNPIVR